jgi:hypothetical protein
VPRGERPDQTPWIVQYMIPEEKREVDKAVRAYRINSAIHDVRDHLRRTWISWAIFFVVVIEPSLGDKEEGVFALRLLTFIAGMAAGVIPSLITRDTHER